MPGSAERVMKALSHQRPDRTPLFEIFQDFQPIHWDVCGHTVATDETMFWDAMADGLSRDEWIEAKARAVFTMSRFFGVDMVRTPGDPPETWGDVKKTGPTLWRRNGVDYTLNPKTKLVVLANPAEAGGYSSRRSEDEFCRMVDALDDSVPPTSEPAFAVWRRVRQLAEAEGLDWVYMAEIGGGTGVAFYPSFLLMWFVTEPERLRRWIRAQVARVLPAMRGLIRAGASVVATGGDVSCDKGPFISPAHYREFILPALREQVDFIHACGAKAVYTSDGNHWPIRDDFFFNSGIDGYKEVDYAAGMTFERLISEGVADRVCIIGNMDARRLMCHGSPDEVRAATRRCLELGRQTRGGHILHLSHSVHEDVRPENYFALVETYREVVGLGRLDKLAPST